MAGITTTAVTLAAVNGVRYSTNSAGAPTAPTAGTPVVDSTSQIRVPITGSLYDTLEGQYRQTGSGTWLVHGTVGVEVAIYTYSALPLDDTGYDFRFVVTANSQAAASNTVTATTDADTPVVAPTLSAPVMGSTTASVAFSGGSGHITLIPQYSINGSSWTSISNDLSSPFSFSGLTPSTLYYFRALPDGDTGNPSNTVSDTTSAAAAGARTITGTGLGAAPSIAIFDRADGVSGDPYSLSADVGSWDSYNDIAFGTNTNCEYVTYGSRTGLSGRDPSQLNSASANLCGLVAILPTLATEFYIEYRVVVPSGRCLPGASPNTNSKTWTDTDSRWKLTWGWNSNFGQTVDTDSCYPTIIPTASLRLIGNACRPDRGAAGQTISFSMTNFSASDENVLGTYCREGTSQSSADGTIEIFQANGTAVTRTSYETARPFMGSVQSGHDTFLFNGWSGSVSQVNVQHVWMDMYLAYGSNSRARVYTHSSPTIAGSAEIYNVTATNTAWSSTSITVTPATREALTYMSVISADGTLHENVSWS